MTGRESHDLLDLTALQTFHAYVHVLNEVSDAGADLNEVRLESADADAVGMTDFVALERTFTANGAHFMHGNSPIQVVFAAALLAGGEGGI